MTCPGCGFENQPNYSYCIKCGTQLPATSNVQSGFTPPPVEEHPHVPPQTDTALSQAQYAGFLVRVLAQTLDGLVLYTLAFILGGVVGFVSRDAEIGMGFGILVFLLINPVYMVVGNGIYGHTLGKKFLNLRVVSETGEVLGIGKGLLREIIGKFVSGILYLGYIWVAFDEKKQGWHDKIAGSFVVQEEPLAAKRKALAIVGSTTGYIVLLFLFFAVISSLPVDKGPEEETTTPQTSFESDQGNEAKFELPATAYQYFAQASEKAESHNPDAHLVQISNQKISKETANKEGAYDYWSYIYYDPTKEKESQLFAVVLDNKYTLTVNENVVLFLFTDYGDIEPFVGSIDSQEAYTIAINNGGREREEKYKVREVNLTLSHNLRKNYNQDPVVSWNVRFNYERDEESGQFPSMLEYWIDPKTGEVLDLTRYKSFTDLTWY